MSTATVPQHPIMGPLASQLDSTNVHLIPRIVKLISLCANLKNEIIVTYPSGWRLDIDVGPPILPPAIVQFVSAACVMPPEDVRDCWTKVKDVVWCMEPNELGDAHLLGVFRKFGRQHGLSEYTVQGLGVVLLSNTNYF